MAHSPSNMEVDMDDKLPMDLESHISNYRGQMKVQRLLHIARHAPILDLRAHALRMAYAEVKDHSYNVDLFSKVCQLARELNVSGCDDDQQWQAKAKMESEALKKRLESDLAAATANNIRESVRQSAMELGTFHYERSDYNTASKMFMRTRDLCSNNKQMLDFCLAVIKTYVLTQNWPMVATFVGKAESMLAEPSNESEKQIRAQMYAVAGLSDLCMNRQRQAAVNFSKVGPELGSSFDDVITSVDVARYGVLTALATHDRTSLRPLFLNSQSFATHLESMLEAREVLEAMCTSRFAEAFRILDDLKPALMLDPFLTHQVPRLERDIRCRVLQQYTRPFHSVRLKDMAEALGANAENLETELAGLIVEGTIKARIDSHNKVLYRKVPNERVAAMSAVLQAADDYIATAHTVLLRAQLAKCHLRPQGILESHGIGSEGEDGMLDAVGGGASFAVGESFAGGIAAIGRGFV